MGYIGVILGLYWDNGKENGIYYLGFRVKCRPMINKPPPFKGLNITIPMIIAVKGRGFIDRGSTLPYSLPYYTIIYHNLLYYNVPRGGPGLH